MTPKRLEKQTESISIFDKVDTWIYNHTTLLLVLLVFILYIVVILLLREFCAMESGMMRNFIINGI